jgi:hypothetical protein
VCASEQSEVNCVLLDSETGKVLRDERQENVDLSLTAWALGLEGTPNKKTDEPVELNLGYSAEENKVAEENDKQEISNLEEEIDRVGKEILRADIRRTKDEIDELGEEIGRLEQARMNQIARDEIVRLDKNVRDLWRFILSSFPLISSPLSNIDIRLFLD